MSMTRTGIVGAELTESETTLRVFLAAGGLIVLGILFLLLTIWWWRSTKPESPALGPLEVMSDRKWMTAADGERRRLLEAHRPEGAAAVFVAPVPEDLSQLAREAPSSFDDLRDPVDPPAAVGEAAVDPEAAELAARDMVREDVAESDGAEGQDGADGADGAGAESDGAESDLAAGPDGSAPSGDSEDHHDGAAAEGSDGDRDSVGDDGVSVDATVAMTRDGAMASEASDRSSFVPHPGT